MSFTFEKCKNTTPFLIKMVAYNHLEIHVGQVMKITGIRFVVISLWWYMTGVPCAHYLLLEEQRYLNDTKGMSIAELQKYTWEMGKLVSKLQQEHPL
jgi:hypothetical protein